MDIQVADTLLGSLIDGRYRIRGRVARGGMATVYTATDERLERTVALKIIHPNQVPDARARLAGFVERFTDEAKTIARLTHPNVVAVYDQGVHNGLPYLVMEYVRGRTLREILAERRRLNPGEALAILDQMLAAIAAAHRAGLVHRDVKPENVLVAEAPSGGAGNLVDSVVKVADFGLARAVEASADEESGGQLMATVAYVAPELVTEGRADPRTDVYSAGIVLFEMLTGRVPYDGERPVDVAWQHVDNDVPPPSKLVPGLPALVDTLVTRATKRDPGARPTDAGALLTEVQGARDELGNASVHTTVLRQIAQPTMAVAPVTPTARPSWARLPDAKAAPAGAAPQPQEHESAAQPRRRRAAGPEPDGVGLADRLRTGWQQVMNDRRGRIAVVASIVVIGLLLVSGGWWFSIGRYTEAPTLVSVAKAEAETQARQGGFTIAYGEPRFDETVERDVVLQQDPPANEKILKGGTITLVLSLGAERYEVPDVLGKTFDLAQADLDKIRLSVVKGPDRFDNNLPAGTVVAIDPAVGTEVKPGDRITVTVSKGRAPITVPNLIGKSVTEARTMLAQLGLVASETYVDNDKQPKDQVLTQDPPDGAGVEKGAKITIEVSKGPPMVVVQRVLGLPCPQAKAALEAQGLPVRVDLNPNGTVAYQQPGENAQVPPGTEVAIGCI